MKMMNLDSPNLSRVLLETSALKEGARIAVGEWSPQAGGKKPTRGNI
jgi:hypothetical protein